MHLYNLYHCDIILYCCTCELYAWPLDEHSIETPASVHHLLRECIYRKSMNGLLQLLQSCIAVTTIAQRTMHLKSLCLPQLSMRQMHAPSCGMHVLLSSFTSILCTPTIAGAESMIGECFTRDADSDAGRITPSLWSKSLHIYLSCLPISCFLSPLIITPYTRCASISVLVTFERFSRPGSTSTVIRAKVTNSEFEVLACGCSLGQGHVEVCYQSKIFWELPARLRYVIHV